MEGILSLMLRRKSRPQHPPRTPKLADAITAVDQLLTELEEALTSAEAVS